MARKFAYHANCWGPLGGNAVGVTSIGELTYRTFGDMERAIREIGSIGYEGIELFDGNLLDYDGSARGELRALLDGAGLKLVAAYSGANFIFKDILDEELARIERVGGGGRRSRRRASGRRRRRQARRRPERRRSPSAWRRGSKGWRRSRKGAACGLTIIRI